MPTLGVFKINPSLVSHQLPVSPSLQNYLGKIFLACSPSSHTEPTGGVILYAASKSQRSEPGPAARGPRVGSSSRKRASGGHLAEYTGDTRRPRLTGVVFQPGRFSLLTGEKGEQADEFACVAFVYWELSVCLLGPGCNILTAVGRISRSRINGSPEDYSSQLTWSPYFASTFTSALKHHLHRMG